VSGGYRTNGSFLASYGAYLQTFGLHYAYYYQMYSMNALAPMQNEITIGFYFGKKETAVYA